MNKNTRESTLVRIEILRKIDDKIKWNVFWSLTYFSKLKINNNKKARVKNWMLELLLWKKNRDVKIDIERINPKNLFDFILTVEWKTIPNKNIVNINPIW